MGFFISHYIAFAYCFVHLHCIYTSGLVDMVYSQLFAHLHYFFFAQQVCSTLLCTFAFNCCAQLKICIAFLHIRLLYSTLHICTFAFNYVHNCTFASHFTHQVCSTLLCTFAFNFAHNCTFASHFAHQVCSTLVVCYLTLHWHARQSASKWPHSARFLCHRHHCHVNRHHCFFSSFFSSSCYLMYFKYMIHIKMHVIFFKKSQVATFSSLSLSSSSLSF